VRVVPCANADAGSAKSMQSSVGNPVLRLTVFFQQDILAVHGMKRLELKLADT
jgi:hypothetical protein